MPPPPPSETELKKGSRGGSEKPKSSAAHAPPASEDETGHPSIPPLPAAGPWRSYKEIVAGLAATHRRRAAPDPRPPGAALGQSIEEQFKKARYRELPKVDAEYYDKVELGFDPRAKAAEFEEIARDVERELGETDAIGAILARTALEYRDVVRMLAARGTPEFYAYSRKLYGSPKDKFPDGKTTLRDLGHVLYDILTNIDDERCSASNTSGTSPRRTPPRSSTPGSTSYFGDDTGVRVEVDDTILSDAAAGSDYVKVRSGAIFSERDIDILEVHEGWVHVATSLNGQAQTVARWLAKGPPRTTTVQEGLAALCEIFTFRTYPRRARRLNDRVLAVDKAEDGASFLDVFEWYRTEGYDEDECFHNTRRIFRGGVVEGRRALHQGRLLLQGHRPQLRLHAERHPAQPRRADSLPLRRQGRARGRPGARARVTDGVVKPPRYLPPMFRDMNGLAIWMAYSTFFTRLGGDGDQRLLREALRARRLSGRRVTRAGDGLDPARSVVWAQVVETP